MNRCVALIDGNALKNNISLIKARTHQQKTIVMVKANAYGHGLIEIATLLKDDSTIAFGVAALKEAIVLRQNGITNQIFLFDGGAFVDHAQDIFHYDVTPVISSIRALHEIINEAKKHTKTLPIHLKIDTGFNRNGLDFNAILNGTHDEDLQHLKNQSNIILEGMATHFCLADYPESLVTEQQMERFQACLTTLLEKNISFRQVHFANSAAVLRSIPLAPQFGHLEILNRPGLLVYGINPLHEDPSFMPVMSIKARIVAIKNLEASHGVGYGHTFHASSARQIGIVAMGYGDGLKRCLSNRASVLIHGQYAPIIGTISMDSCAIDLHQIPEVKEGDWVTLLGKEQHHRITAKDWAAMSDTIPWEILTSITARIDRVVV